MFQYKIIHHIIFTNTDFEQNEKKKACLLLSLFHCFGKPTEMAELAGFSAVIFNSVLCICKRFVVVMIWIIVYLLQESIAEGQCLSQSRPRPSPCISCFTRTNWVPLRGSKRNGVQIKLVLRVVLKASYIWSIRVLKATAWILKNALKNVRDLLCA